MMTAACEVGLAVIFGMKSSVQRDMVRIQALGCPWRNAEEALGLSGGRSCGNGCRDDEKSGTEGDVKLHNSEGALKFSEERRD